MKILFVSSWFPYPPSNGSRIRAYHLLRALAAQHQVVLLSFEDAPVEESAREHLAQFCERVVTVPRAPFAANVVSARLGLFSLLPSSVVAQHSPEMEADVRRIMAEWKPNSIVAMQFYAARYAADIPGITKIVDVDFPMASMLYEEYQQTRGMLRRARRYLAYQKFWRYERQLYARFDLRLVVSNADRDDLTRKLGNANGIAVVPNGVDVAHNAPNLATPEPDTLVFNGALSYHANYDAMRFFLRDVFPLVQAQAPHAHLRVTGKTDEIALDDLDLNESVTLTGFVPDIRKTVAGSWTCVAPVRVGGGTRLKILEAMALGTPVVSTAKGAAGLDALNGEQILIADAPADFAAQTVRVLREPALRNRLAVNARQLVVQKYNWTVIGKSFCDQVRQAIKN